MSDRAGSLTRRHVLQLATAVAAARAYPAFAAVPREADIVVIGAGAAGLAAARRITAANRKVVVIEATAAVGGRCQTDAATFALPFDRGARLLYNPDTNPLVRLARVAAMEMTTAPQGQKIRIGRRNARAGEAEDFLATGVRAYRAIDDAAHRGDMACATVLPKDLREWTGATEFLLGPASFGKDLRDLSVVDPSRAERRDASASLRQGLGTLLVKLSEGLPIALSTPATRVVWSNRDVSVETTAGTIAARAVILTVSTNVLGSGRIKFAPELPRRQLEAVSHLSLGSSDHIALELPGNPLGLSRDDVFIEQSSDARTALLSANLGGSSLCLVDVGGGFGRDLAAQGDAAMRAFAVDWLVKLFGSDVAAAVKTTSTTNWNAAPFVLGAMSATAPGGGTARHVLAEPLGALFLAGEAVHDTAFGTIGGAWDSGERAADAALKRLGPVKESEPPKPARTARRTHPKPQPVPGPSSLLWPHG